MKALITDDSMVIRSILKKMLHPLGFETVEAKDGQDALSKLSSEQGFSLALVDWNMPVMNGLDLVKSIRKDEKYFDLKIVMVTTESEITQMAAAMDAGANEYIMKPFTQEIVVEKLKMLGILPE